MDIERSILGTILISTPEEQLDFYSNCGEKYFLDQRNKEIFNAFGHALLAKKKINTLVLVELQKNDSIGLTIEEIKSLNKDISYNFTIEEHIKLLKERYYKQSVAEKIKKSISDIEKLKLYDEIKPIKEDLIVQLSSIDIEHDSNFIDHKENLIKLQTNLNSERKIEGYSWGIRELDIYTSGIVSPLVYVIGGLKKSGKSRFLIGLRKELAKQGIPTPILSLEMPSYEITKLTLASEYGYNDIKLRAGGFMTKEEKTQINSAEINFDLFPTECISGLDLGAVLTRIRRYSTLFPNAPILIDYIQRINHNTQKQAQELEWISKSIADAARKYNVPIIILSQMANIAERETPTIGHLKGSGGIAEAADVIMLLDNIYRRTKKDEKKNIFSITLEQRYGDSAVFEIYGDLGTCRFAALEENYNHFEEVI